MKRLPPMLSYYGSKWRLAPKYPAPLRRVIVEPFAGGAGYSLLHPDHDVLLVDLHEPTIGAWEFLILAKESEILSLPLVRPGEDVTEFSIPQEAKWLIGYWLQPASAWAPKKRTSSWAASHDTTTSTSSWGAAKRAQIASVVHRIRHWSAVAASYSDIPGMNATWFVDPPHQVKGAGYNKGARDIDFAELGSWCKSREGQVVVCENEGAQWLPFERLCSHSGQRGRKSVEVLWVK